MNKIVEFVKANPARLYGVLVALLPVALTIWPDLPTDALLTIAAAVLGVGHVVQNTEDAKTDEALFTPVPGDDLA